MISLFGYEFIRKQPLIDTPVSFVPKEHDDGAITVAAAGAFGQYIDLDGTVRTEAELISRYRDMSLHPEVDQAIDEITNETIATDELELIKLRLDKLEGKLPDTVLDGLQSCFEEILKLLNFQNFAYEIFRRWYIDGRLYFHCIIDPANTTDGLQEIRYIDPRKIRKIREVVKVRVAGGDGNLASGAAVVTHPKNEYYVYNDKGFNIGNRVVGGSSAAQGLKIAKDAIVYVTSGITDTAGTMCLGYLHKAIKPLNQLRTLEDAVVIYRLARAPERRLWYIDVGNLPKLKAEQYVRDIMVKHKNRVNYDASTGNIRDDRKFMTMLEDYWLPRREGGRGTEVSTLPAGQNLGEMEDVLYFQKRLYNSLHVPINRLNPDNQYDLGIATQITRDELKFGKFISRMRLRFSQIFIKLLEKQVVLKGIMTIEDYQKLIPYLVFDYARDNYFTEQKNQFLLEGRMNLLMLMQPFVGKYYSNAWVRKNILTQSIQDQEQMDKEIVEELNNPLYHQMPAGPPEEDDQQDDGQEMGPPGAIVDPRLAPPNAGGPKPGGDTPGISTPKGNEANPDNAQSRKNKKHPKGANDFSALASLISKTT